MQHSSNMPSDGRQPAHGSLGVRMYRDGEWTIASDRLAVERALEIHIAGASPLITMCTPGDDTALAAGLLFAEGVVHQPEDMVYLKHAAETDDVVRVMLRPAARARLDNIERNTVATSACGVCGKPSFAPVMPARTQATAGDGLCVAPETLLRLPETLRQAQAVFSTTGGLHAAGLFDSQGALVDLAEDVGRHNALDKLIGRALLGGQLPLRDRIVLLSSRASFELVQKSLMAGVVMICAISAPSSYAVSMAQDFGITLVGFLRDGRFNVYSGPERIRGADRSG